MTDRGTRIASSPQRLAILDALRLARGPLDAAQIRKLVPSAKVGLNGHMRALEEAGAVNLDGSMCLNPAQLSALEQRLRDVIAQFRAEELTTEAPDAEDVLVILSAVPMRSSRPI